MWSCSQFIRVYICQKIILVQKGLTDLLQKHKWCNYKLSKISGSLWPTRYMLATLHQQKTSTIWPPLLPGDQCTETTCTDQRYQLTNATSWWSTLPAGNLHADNSPRRTLPARNLYIDNSCWSTLLAGDQLYQLVTSTSTTRTYQLYQVVINSTSW